MGTYEVKSEDRQDRARRELKLSDYPDVEVAPSAYSSRTQSYLWRPELLTLHWSQGVLTDVRIMGARLLKNGKPGESRREASWHRSAGDCWKRGWSAGQIEQMPEWLAELIKTQDVSAWNE